MLEVDYKNITEVLNEYYNLFIKNKPKKLLVLNKYRKEYCQDQLAIKPVATNITKELCIPLNNFTKNITDAVISVTNSPLIVNTNNITHTNYSFPASTNKYMQKINNNSNINLIISVSVVVVIISGVLIIVGIKYFTLKKYKKKKYRVNVIDSESML
jgi:hypothetical protein